MRKLSLVLILAALILAFAVVPAFADVDPVSQAGCGNSDNSGAKNQASRDAPGRPDALIPVTASGGASGSGGGNAPAQGPHC